MIARILGTGQFEISDDLHRRLDALDEQAVAALDASDEETLDGVLAQMADLVEPRERGCRTTTSARPTSSSRLPT